MRNLVERFTTEANRLKRIVDPCDLAGFEARLDAIIQRLAPPSSERANIPADQAACASAVVAGSCGDIGIDVCAGAKVETVGNSGNNDGELAIPSGVLLDPRTAAPKLDPQTAPDKLPTTWSAEPADASRCREPAAKQQELEPLLRAAVAAGIASFRSR